MYVWQICITSQVYWFVLKLCEPNAFYMQFKDINCKFRHEYCAEECVVKLLTHELFWFNQQTRWFRSECVLTRALLSRAWQIRCVSHVHRSRRFSWEKHQLAAPLFIRRSHRIWVRVSEKHAKTSTQTLQCANTSKTNTHVWHTPLNTLLASKSCRATGQIDPHWFLYNFKNIFKKVKNKIQIDVKTENV